MKRKMVPRAAILMAQNARDKFAYYQREIETLLRRGDLLLASLRKIPAGDYTQRELFFQGDEILGDIARMKNGLANARAELEVAERVAHEDSILVDEEEKERRNEMGIRN